MCQVVVTNMLEGQYCDKCGAVAYYMSALQVDGELFWCAHHYKQYAVALEPLTEYLADESHRLYDAIKDEGSVEGATAKA
jgi:hypothetical protein